MGLFDSIRVETPLAPGLEAYADYQTKSFDPAMDQYILDDTGKLWLLEIEREWVPEPSDLFGGHLKEVSSKTVPCPFTGDVEMHTVKDGQDDVPHQKCAWISYELRFEEGKMVSWKLLEG